MKIENQVIFMLYNVCSVHRGVLSTWGDIMSTSGDVKYIWGIS